MATILAARYLRYEVNNPDRISNADDEITQNATRSPIVNSDIRRHQSISKVRNIIFCKHEAFLKLLQMFNL